MKGDHALTSRADELRRGFDDAFAAPRNVVDARYEDFLAIRVCGDPYALRLSDAAGLYADRKIVPVPDAPARFLGLCALRGALAPVFGLGELLGYAGSAAPRWLILMQGAPVALAFDLFEGHVRADEAAIASGEGIASRAHARGIVQDGENTRPIVDAVSILDAIKAASRADGVHNS